MLAGLSAAARTRPGLAAMACLLGLAATQVGCPLLDSLTPAPTPRATATPIDVPAAPSATAGAASVRLLSPTGGETWLAGGSYVISWESQNLTGPVTIELFRGGELVTPIFREMPANGRFTWDIPVDKEGSGYAVRVRSQDDPAVFDETDGTIQIARALITIESPSGGEAWGIGRTYAITWLAHGVAGPARIELLYGDEVRDLGADVSLQTGAWVWTVPGNVLQERRDYLIRVSSVDHPRIYGQSVMGFGLLEPWITVDVPDGGENWSLCAARQIEWRWAVLDEQDKVRIDLVRGGDPVVTIASCASNDGTHTWQIPCDLEPGMDYEVRICALEDDCSEGPDALCDESNMGFKIDGDAATAIPTETAVPVPTAPATTEPPTDTATATATPTTIPPTHTPTPTDTSTPSDTPTATDTPGPTPTATNTPTDTATLTPTPTATSLPLSTVTVDLGDGVTMDVVYLPAGSFVMGSPESDPDHPEREQPQRLVNVSAFAMGNTEVAQAQWRAMMGTDPSFFAGRSSYRPSSAPRAGGKDSTRW